PLTEAPGISVFYKDDAGTIFHTYSCYGRGLDVSSSVSTVPSRPRYCGNWPQTPVMGIAYGWVPAFRWQFWQARLLPAKRFAASETSGPISFGVSVKSACPYLTSSPNGSSPTLLISGGVHCVRSIATVSAAGI